MKKFTVEFGWRHEIVDYVDVEIEARNAVEARKKAEELLLTPGYIDSLEWKDGEVMMGSYEVLDVQEGEAAAS